MDYLVFDKAPEPKNEGYNKVKIETNKYKNIEDENNEYTNRNAN